MIQRRTDRAAATRAIRSLLQATGAPIDSDPELKGTPERVADAWIDELLAGYRERPERVLAECTATRTPGLVVVARLPVATTCPHHLMPALGLAHVGYLPTTEVVGFGAIGRLVDCFARRLTLQEALGQNVVDALVRVLRARGAACVLDLEPTCLTARGTRRHGGRALTQAWAGAFVRLPSLRWEFLQLLGDQSSRPLSKRKIRARSR